jgi:hypothetical protein
MTMTSLAASVCVATEQIASLIHGAALRAGMITETVVTI